MAHILRIDCADGDTGICLGDRHPAWQKHTDTRVDSKRFKQKLEIAKMQYYLVGVFLTLFDQAMFKQVCPDQDKVLADNCILEVVDGFFQGLA